MKKSTKSERPRQPRSPRSSRKKRQGAEGQLLDLRKEIRETLMVEIRGTVSAVADQLVEDEVTKLVGEPWSRKGESPLRRNGRTETTIFLDGEPHLIKRARVRDQDSGSEYPLQTMQALRSRDALDEDVKARLVRGITTRNYEDTLTSLSDGLGLKKSAVSSAFQRAAKKDLDALNGRSLSDWTFAVIYIDGTGFADHTCVVAMGVDESGKKRVPILPNVKSEEQVSCLTLRIAVFPGAGMVSLLPRLSLQGSSFECMRKDRARIACP